MGVIKAKRDHKLTIAEIVQDVLLTNYKVKSKVYYENNLDTVVCQINEFECIDISTSQTQVYEIRYHYHEGIPTPLLEVRQLITARDLYQLRDRVDRLWKFRNDYQKDTEYCAAIKKDGTTTKESVGRLHRPDWDEIVMMLETGKRLPQQKKLF